MVYLFYTTFITVDPAHHEIVRANVGKGGIKCVVPFFNSFNKISTLV